MGWKIFPASKFTEKYIEMDDMVAPADFSVARLYIFGARMRLSYWRGPRVNSTMASHVVGT